MTRRAAYVVVLALSTSALPAGHALAMSAGGAQAGPSTQVFNDPVGDAPRAIDITRVSVTKSASKKKIFVTLSGRNFKGNRTQIADTYFDTRRKDGGPEFRLTAFSRNDGDSRKGLFLLATERWSGGQRVRCGGALARFNTGRDKIRLAVPKACLERPKAVRVNTAVWDVTKYTSRGWKGFADFAPREKRWYRWVR